MKIYYSKHFLKVAKKLNTKQQAKLARLVVLLQKDPYHPKLHTKALSGELVGIYSCSTTRDFRVLFKFLSYKEIMLIDVGNRKDTYH